MSYYNKKLKLLINLLLIAILLFVSLFFLYATYFVKIDLEKLTAYRPMIATTIYDGDDGIIGHFADEKRILVDIKDVPRMLINAFVSAEDRTFYTNLGFDASGMINAAIKDVFILLTMSNERMIGASTITQQLVRGVVLDNSRTIVRKLNELILSFKITMKMSKDEIMQCYLNEIFLGSQYYGVASAAKGYFDKNLEDLTLAECALLAALPKAPSFLDPRKNQSRIYDRRNWVLLQMFDNNFITKEQLDQATKEEIILAPKLPSIQVGNAFVDVVKRLVIDSGLEEISLYRDGYNIHTAMNRNWQNILQEEFDKGIIELDRALGYRGAIGSVKDLSLAIEYMSNLNIPNIGDFKLATIKLLNKHSIELLLQDGSDKLIKFDDLKWALGSKEINQVFSIGDVIVVDSDVNDNKKISLVQIPEVNGGAIAVNPKNGEIKSLVGGYLDIPGAFNRVTMAKRQPGSLLKPFVYLTALSNGVSPLETLIDTDLQYEFADGAVWQPKNHTETHYGLITIRYGFERSLNIVTIKLAEMIGIGKVVDVLKKFHISPNPAYELATALGSSESTILDLANGFVNIANGCTENNLRLIKMFYGSGLNDDVMSRINEGTIKSSLFINEKSDNNYESDNIYSSNINDDIKEIKNDELLDLSIKQQNIQIKDSAIENVKKNKITDDLSCYQIISFMSGAVARGTASQLSSLGIPIIAKTGTSNGGKDLLSVAITPELVIVVQLGYDIPKDTNLYGGGFAMPIIKNFIERIKKDLQGESFKVPNNLKTIKISWKNGEFCSNVSCGNSGDSRGIFEYIKPDDAIFKSKQKQISFVKKSSTIDKYIY